MFTFIFRRLAFVVVLTLGMMVAIFVLTHIIPSDPARVAVGPDASTEAVEAMRIKMGLDKPLVEQFGLYLWKAIHLDLGISLYNGQPVWDEIIRYAPASIELAVVSTALSVVVGLSIGIYCAANHSSLSDTILTLTVIAGRAAPSFWIALLLQLIFYGKLGWFPSGERIDLLGDIELTRITGMYLIDSVLTLNWPAFWDSAYHLVLPSLALGLGGIAVVSRMTKASVLLELQRDYVRTAYSKGLTRRAVLFRHAVRNAINPVVTIVGIRFGYLLAGTILIESIFRWPGIGRYALLAINYIDYPVIMGVTLFVSIAFALVNLCVDFIYMLLDPRVRYS